MAFELCILQILIDAEIKLVWQEKVINLVFELKQVIKRQSFTDQCNIYIGKRLVGFFGS